MCPEKMISIASCSKLSKELQRALKLGQVSYWSNNIFTGFIQNSRSIWPAEILMQYYFEFLHFDFVGSIVIMKKVVHCMLGRFKILEHPSISQFWTISWKLCKSGLVSCNLLLYQYVGLEVPLHYFQKAV